MSYWRGDWFRMGRLRDPHREAEGALDRVALRVHRRAKPETAQGVESGAIALRTDGRDDARALESPVRRDHDDQADRLVVMGGEQVPGEEQRGLLHDLR